MISSLGRKYLIKYKEEIEQLRTKTLLSIDVRTVEFEKFVGVEYMNEIGFAFIYFFNRYLINWKEYEFTIQNTSPERIKQSAST